MCDYTIDCDGRMIQGACSDCGAHPQADDYARFSGGAGARTHPLSDEDYRREMEKLTAKAGK